MDNWGLGKDINKTSIALTVGGLGTPGYCSPEQWFANQDIDGRTNIFSLGMIFYYMLTGRLPSFDPITGRRPPIDPPSAYHPSISYDLDYAILKMIDMNPSSRYQNINELTHALLLIQMNL